MPDNESLYKIALQVEGQEKAAKLAADVAAAEKQLKALIAANGGVGSSSAQMAAGVQAQAAALKGLKDQLEGVHKSNAKLAGGFKANTQGLSQLGYAIDDIQYGQEAA